MTFVKKVLQKSVRDDDTYTKLVLRKENLTRYRVFWEFETHLRRRKRVQDYSKDDCSKSI